MTRLTKRLAYIEAVVALILLAVAINYRPFFYLLAATWALMSVNMFMQHRQSKRLDDLADRRAVLRDY